MIHYLIRRLLLLPITLFFIILVNFGIINLAPGDPVTISNISQEGLAKRQESASLAIGKDQRYLQFREHYGLTLPIFFNNWPWIHQEQVNDSLWSLIYRQKGPFSSEEMGTKELEELRIRLGDQARFVMPLLLNTVEETNQSLEMRKMALKFFVRGGMRQAFLGPDLTEEQKKFNRKIAKENDFLFSFLLKEEPIDSVAKQLKEWSKKNGEFYQFYPSPQEKIKIFFFDTRFFRYMSRVLTLDFGTMRNDDSKNVIDEVSKRFKYSLTLSFLPMIITFFLCLFFGFAMAFWQRLWPDLILNLIFLILYAIPVFVVAPFLIEKVALNHTFPFTDIPIPISGFTSPEIIYDEQISYQRLIDILTHIFLPITAIAYGSLAAQSRLARTAVLEVMRQDYVRTAKAKGVSTGNWLFKHVGRNAAITIVTSLAASLGIVLGGSLIVETLFEIDGFGKFFYDAIINRDYNVIMFSALAGSFLSLVGYLVADIAYTVLDPRLTLD